jgi:Holliday junction DNA helicase RuvA
MLSGQVVQEEADGSLVVDVNGVGYDVLAPLGTVGRLRGAAQAAGKTAAEAVSSPGASPKVTLFIHTHVREDSFQLFGFSSSYERATFRALLNVSTVGPRTAMSVLSALPADDLARVIARKELARLVAVPGIGKKIAERLLLELRDKMPAPGATAPAPRGGRAVADAGPASDNRAMLISALTNMGYKPPEAEKAAELLGERLTILPLGEAIREGLRLLAK